MKIEMKYRKKPVVIEAFQLTPQVRMSRELWPDWAQQAFQVGYLVNHPSDKEARYVTPLIIHTLEGDMEAMIGDYIICGIKGEIYPCKPDIFEMTYDLVTT